jgi:hypothetical protein
MWKLLAPGVRLVDFLTPEQGRMPVHVFINGPAKHYLHSFSLYFYLSSIGWDIMGYKLSKDRKPKVNSLILNLE